jgi:hypothetical protein
MNCLSSAVFAAITALPAITAGKPVLSRNGCPIRTAYQIIRLCPIATFNAAGSVSLTAILFRGKFDGKR